MPRSMYRTTQKLANPFIFVVDGRIFKITFVLTVYHLEIPCEKNFIRSANLKYICSQKFSKYYEIMWYFFSSSLKKKKK